MLIPVKQSNKCYTSILYSFCLMHPCSMDLIFEYRAPQRAHSIFRESHYRASIYSDWCTAAHSSRPTREVTGIRFELYCISRAQIP